MNNWQTKRLGDICKTSSGGTPLKSRSEYYKNGTIPWLRSGEVAQGEIKKSELLIAEIGLKESSAKIFPKDTVLVAMYGATAGEVGILKFEASTNQAICGILPNDKLFPEFLYNMLRSKKEKMSSLASGGAQPNISQTVIKNLEISLPSLAEQKRIVKVLDEKLEKVREMISAREQSLADTEKIISTRLREIFEQGKNDGWEERVLAECTDKIFGGGTPSKSNPAYWNGGVPWASVKDLKEGQYTLKTTRDFITREGLDNSSAKLVPEGALILATRMGLGRIVKTEIKTAINQDLKAIFVNKNVLTEYFLYFMRTKSEEMKAKGSGATVSGIKLDYLKSIKVPVPSIKIQQKVVTELDVLSEKVEEMKKSQQAQLSDLKKLEHTYLREAFNGEL